MTLKKPFNPPPPEERKEACVVAFCTFYRIRPWAVYDTSTLDPDGIGGDHPADLGDRELGLKTREALLASRFIGPNHPDWDRVGASLTRENSLRSEERLKASAAVKTKTALYKGSG